MSLHPHESSQPCPDVDEIEHIDVEIVKDEVFLDEVEHVDLGIVKSENVDNIEEVDIDENGQQDSHGNNRGAETDVLPEFEAVFVEGGQLNNQFLDEVKHADIIKKEIVDNVQEGGGEKIGEENAAPTDCYLFSCRTHTGDTLVYHLKEDPKMKRFPCHLCSYSGERSLKKHSARKMVKCNACDFMAVSKVCLKLHKMNHSHRGAFECNLSGYKASGRNSLKSQRKGRTVEGYECHYCGHRTIKRSHLRGHIDGHAERPTAI